MAKMPKKTTMLDVLARVRGYAIKLHLANKLTAKQWIEVQKALLLLQNKIDPKA